MKKLHLSPATGISLLALFVSLSGTAYAVTTIRGSQLDDRSVSHTKLDKHTITAAELNTARLGTVPKARRATNAAELGGIRAADYTQNVWATQSSKPLTLKGGKRFSAILTQPFVNDAPKKAGFLNFAEVSVTNLGSEPVTVTLGLSIDKHSEPGRYGSTVGAGDTQSIFALLKCNGMSPGHHTVSLTASTTGEITLGTRADDGLRPIVIPPGHSRFTGEG